MAEVAGLALSVFGTVGILGQIFDGCIKGYRVFSHASNLGKDSERLICKVKIEEKRLWVWGREWGIGEGKVDTQLAIGIWDSDELKDLAREILTQLFRTIMDCNKLQGRYGLREAAPGSVDKEAYQRSADLTLNQQGSRPQTPSTLKFFKDDLKLKARWVIADKEKFETFLDDLQYFNNRLEGLFPPSRKMTHERMVTNELLQTAQRDRVQLNNLESASLEKYPRLNAFAHLKQLRINLDAEVPSRQILSSSVLNIPRSRIDLTASDESSPGSQQVTRVRGIYNQPLDKMRGDAVAEPVPIIIDWIYYDQVADMDARLHLYQRVDNLARMLHSCSSRHPDLSTLDCIGYTDDKAASRYGIIHRSPPEVTQDNSTPPSFRTLSILLDDPGKRTPDLDVRFRLAHKLAVALWSFHSLDWLHKSFCSLNILFFDSPSPPPYSAVPGSQDTKTTPNIPIRPPLPRTASSRIPEQHDLQTPSILGFDSSRPEGLVEMTYNAKLSSPDEIYRHPDSLGMDRAPYCKSFDVYALGLVLLELGLWKSVRVIYKPKYGPREFREKVSQGLVPALGSKTGSRYRRIVEECLSYDERREEEGRNPHQMMEWVVLSLEALRV